MNYWNGEKTTITASQAPLAYCRHLSPSRPEALGGVPHAMKPSELGVVDTHQISGVGVSPWPEIYRDLQLLSAQFAPHFVNTEWVKG